MIRKARCSLGMRGIVLRDKHWIKYPDGTFGYACTGLHFPKVWRRWSSRNPRWGW